ARAAIRTTAGSSTRAAGSTRSTATSGSSLRSRVLVAAALAALALRAEAQDDRGADPLPGTRSLYVLDVPYLHFGPMDLRRPEPGHVAAAFDADYANTFSHTWHPTAIQHERGEFGQEFLLAGALTLHSRH